MIIQCTIEFREDTNRTYDCVFYPSFQGEYKVNIRKDVLLNCNLLFSAQIIITFNEQEVPHSPFLINVDASEAVPEIRIDHDDDADEVDSPGNEITSKRI